MSKFIYNNVKNISISHTLFELNYKYYHHIFAEENIKLYFKSCSTNKLAQKFKDLMMIYC